jgi:hypothetical protein
VFCSANFDQPAFESLVKCQFVIVLTIAMRWLAQGFPRTFHMASASMRLNFKPTT